MTRNIMSIKEEFCTNGWLVDLALDRNKYVAAILMDLSKAFDCLPSDLITEKLRAYGLSNDAEELIHDYLSISIGS